MQETLERKIEFCEHLLSMAAKLCPGDSEMHGMYSDFCFCNVQFPTLKICFLQWDGIFASYIIGSKSEGAGIESDCNAVSLD